MALVNPYQIKPASVGQPVQPGTFGKGNNLISSQINPTPSARTSAYSNATDRASENAANFDRSGTQAGAVQQYRSIYGTGNVAYRPAQTQLTSPTINTQVQGGAAVNPNDSAELQRFRTLLGGSADSLSSLPDRYQTAQTQFDTFAKSTDPTYQAALRDATKLGAANGVMGSGMLSDSYGTIAEQRARDLDTQRSNFLTDALNNSIEDRYRTLGAYQGLVGDTANQEAGKRGELRNERGYATDLDTANLGRVTNERNYQDTIGAQNLARATDERTFETGLARDNANSEFARTQAAVGQGAADATAEGNDRYRALDALSSMLSQSSGQDTADANALRGERDYQYGASQDAQQSAIQQYLAQLAAQNQDFQQGVQLDTLGNKNNSNALAARQNAQTSYGNDAASAFGALGTAQNQAGQQSQQAQQQALIQQILDAINSRGGA